MDTAISAVMETNVVFVGINDTVDHVAGICNTNQVSCVPVIDSTGLCFGVISLSDLLHLQVLRKNQKALRAWEVCTHKVIQAGPGMAVREAAELMVKHKVHHIVVMEDDTLKGIVSSLDILNNCVLQG